MPEAVLHAHAATDRGRRRAVNEDAHAVWMAPVAPGAAGRGALLVVADGMGGKPAGEVASRIAVETLVREYAAAGPGDDPVDVLRGALEAANRQVLSAATGRADLKGMGTTCTAAAVVGLGLWVAHAGDSRAYLVRGGSARRLTEDHVLAPAARSGTRTGAVGAPCGVGLRESATFDAERVDATLARGDTVVLCSDGLHGRLEDREIAGLSAAGDLERACRDLIALAQRRGASDDITVVMARLAEAG